MSQTSPMRLPTPVGVETVLVHTEQRSCQSCGAPHVIQEHELAHYDHGHLCCLTCGEELIAWFGTHFFTHAVAPRMDRF